LRRVAGSWFYLRLDGHQQDRRYNPESDISHNVSLWK